MAKNSSTFRGRLLFLRYPAHRRDRVRKAPFGRATARLCVFFVDVYGTHPDQALCWDAARLCRMVVSWLIRLTPLRWLLVKYT